MKAIYTHPEIVFMRSGPYECYDCGHKFKEAYGTDAGAVLCERDLLKRAKKRGVKLGRKAIHP